MFAASVNGECYSNVYALNPRKQSYYFVDANDNRTFRTFSSLTMNSQRIITWNANPMNAYDFLKSCVISFTIKGKRLC